MQTGRPHFSEGSSRPGVQPRIGAFAGRVTVYRGRALRAEYDRGGQVGTAVEHGFGLD